MVVLANSTPVTVAREKAPGNIKTGETGKTNENGKNDKNGDEDLETNFA